MNKFERHIIVNSASSTALTELSAHCSLSLSVIKQAINKGALWLTRGNSTQRLRRIKKNLQVQDELHFYYDAEILAQQPPQAELIADLTHYSVWYKPYGMLSQGSKWSDHCTVSRWAQKHLQPERPAFIVHRLDKAATGLILIAHSKKAASALSGMFEARASENIDNKQYPLTKYQLEKAYQIIVHGDHRLRPQPEIITQTIEGKKARSLFTCHAYNKENNLSLIDVKITTGRKHQIRLHAAEIGFPVVGDRLHGDQSIEYPEALNLQLCADSLAFTCPLSGQHQHFNVPEKYKLSLNNVTTLLS